MSQIFIIFNILASCITSSDESGKQANSVDFGYFVAKRNLRAEIKEFTDEELINEKLFYFSYLDISKIKCTNNQTLMVPTGSIRFLQFMNPLDEKNTDLASVLNVSSLILELKNSSDIIINLAGKDSAVSEKVEVSFDGIQKKNFSSTSEESNDDVSTSKVKVDVNTENLVCNHVTASGSYVLALTENSRIKLNIHFVIDTQVEFKPVKDFALVGILQSKKLEVKEEAKDKKKEKRFYEETWFQGLLVFLNILVFVAAIIYRLRIISGKNQKAKKSNSNRKKKD